MRLFRITLISFVLTFLLNACQQQNLKPLVVNYLNSYYDITSVSKTIFNEIAQQDKQLQVLEVSQIHEQYLNATEKQAELLYEIQLRLSPDLRLNCPDAFGDFKYQPALKEKLIKDTCKRLADPNFNLNYQAYQDLTSNLSTYTESLQSLVSAPSQANIYNFSDNHQLIKNSIKRFRDAPDQLELVSFSYKQLSDAWYRRKHDAAVFKVVEAVIPTLKVSTNILTEAFKPCDLTEINLNKRSVVTKCTDGSFAKAYLLNLLREIELRQRLLQQETKPENYEKLDQVLAKYTKINQLFTNIQQSLKLQQQSLSELELALNNEKEDAPADLWQNLQKYSRVAKETHKMFKDIYK